jgi:hypothetical protein
VEVELSSRMTDQYYGKKKIDADFVTGLVIRW